MTDDRSGTAVPDVQQGHPAGRELLQRVSRERMLGQTKTLAQWQKHAGSPGERKSLRFLQGELADLGFDTEVLFHDAYISLPGDAAVHALGRDIACITHSFARRSPAAGLAGNLVDVGQGTPEEFAAADVAGKVVLVDGIANPVVTEEANRRGALGQIHISPHGYLHEMCISPVWGSPTHRDLERLPQTVVVTVSREDGDVLRKAVAAGDAVPVTLHAEVDTSWRETPILIADMPPPSKGEGWPYVLFSGHHDTWYYGVMDNGTANVTMVEVARLCAEGRQHWQRGLRVAMWSGHSQGRYSSSTWYADAFWEDLERRCVVHVNVDSTGGRGNTVVADTSCAAELAHVARRALRSQADQEYAGYRMQRAGDQSFWGIGVPAIFANMSEQPNDPDRTTAWSSVFGGDSDRKGDGTGWWWHTPHDTFDKIDGELLVRDTRIYQYAVWELLTAPVVPLDHRRQLEEMRETITVYDRAAPAFDLAPVPARVETLLEKVDALQTRLAAVREDDSAAVAAANETLRALSRHLVPLDYTTGDRFDQDPALGLDPLPALAPLKTLGELAPDSDRYRHLEVALMRARNRAAFSLRRASAHVDEGLRRLDQAH